MVDFTRTFYAPGAGGTMEGPWATSRQNPITGDNTPYTLDDVRLGRSPWVTLASDPSRYGQTIDLGDVTYRSPLDQQTYTLPGVRGYVHDTGSAFQGRPDKLDIAQGDFRGWDPRVAESFVGGGRASGGQRMDASSLLGMLGNARPTDVMGQPSNWNDALASRSGSLLGLGMGLLQPYRPWAGESAFGNALKGYQAGAQADESSAQNAWKRGMAEREFARAGQSEFQKMQADLARYKGTPYEDEVKRFYAAKTGETPQIVTLNLDPYDPEAKTQALFNPRMPVGQQFTDLMGKPMNIGAGGGAQQPPQGTAAPNSPVWDQGGGGVGYGRAGVGAGGTFGAGMAGTTTQPPTAAPQAGQTYGTTAKRFENEQKLRKEVEDVAKPYVLATQSYKKMMASQDSAAGDIALIFAYMKMLDPPSTVREGEFATAQNSGGIEDRVRNMYNRLLTGERLQPGQREDFKRQGAAVYERYRTEFEPRMNQYRDIAQTYRIDPRRIIPNIGDIPVGSEQRTGATAVQAPTQTKIPTFNFQTGGFD